MQGRGNINMRGKRSARLDCMCCEAWSGREKAKARIIAVEIRNSKRNFPMNVDEATPPLPEMAQVGFGVFPKERRPR